MSNTTMYCLRCKKHTETTEESIVTLKNGRPAKKGICKVCGAKKFQITSSKKGGSILNTVLNKIPLPEIHMRLPKDIPSENVPEGSFNNTGKYSYCGPFTKLDKRLKQGYKGVNSLDRACRTHDIAYANHTDTPARNHADDILAADASKIALSDVPEYEKKDARTVAAIMATKSRFGLGIKKKKS